MLVVVGGVAPKIGKTAAMCGLIRATRKRNWAALKITEYGHGGCSREPHVCECAPGPDEPFSLTEEYEPGESDSGRYLAAGAHRSFWLRAPAGRLFETAGLIGKIVDQHPNTIIESNGVLDFFDPEVFLMLLDFTGEEVYATSLQYVDRADAFLVVDRGLNAHLCPQVAGDWLAGKPQFLVRPPSCLTADATAFVKSKLDAPTLREEPPSAPRPRAGSRSE
jgi:hypothetical protein